ncbi:MAG TPA: sulfite exporter TauE/SafE family protein, partial [Thermoanaerobaculia bacterium]|nr:sulfite exporter TauE/SafE family protein [Thermoanaerobaculia bacterium]
SLFGYRREVSAYRRWLKTLFLPSLAGGALGSFLLLATPEKTFSHLVPLLIFFATLLFALQGAVKRWSSRARDEVSVPARIRGGRLFAAVLLQLGVAVYGGYFGAGIGILMLTVLGFLGLADIHAMNGLKVFFGASINVVAALYFVSRGAVIWPLALLMVVGAIVGGYGGTHLARWIGPRRVRRFVIAVGVIATIALAWRELYS